MKTLLKFFANIIAFAVAIAVIALCAILGAAFGFHLFVGLLHF